MSASRVAFVTGGAGSIGAAIARALGEGGHRVAVADLAREGAEATWKKSAARDSELMTNHR